MARSIPVLLGFLGRLAGLGGLSDKIREIITRVQGVVDGAIDKVIDWIVAQANRLFRGNRERENKDGKNNKKKGEKDHADIATAASNDLKKEGEELKTYAELRKAKEAQAKQIEQKYQPQLEQGIKIKIIFTEASKDQEDDDLDFEVVIAPNTTKKKGSISSASKEIGEIDISRERMKWFRRTKIEVAKKFIERGAGNAPPSAVDEKTGKIKTKRKWARRHVISFANMKEHYHKAFPPTMTVAQAIEILNKFDIKADKTKKSVHSKIRALVRKAFNDPENVWIGDQATNSTKQEITDPSPEMIDSAQGKLQKKIDEHVKKFLERWGIPGVSFTLTQEKVIIEWVITEIS